MAAGILSFLILSRIERRIMLHFRWSHFLRLLLWGWLDRDGDDECRTFAQGRVENDFSAKQRNQFLGDGQSQTGTLDALGALQSRKRLEHFLFLLIGHSLSRILYAQGKRGLAQNF